jgi:hypothetical protein
LEGVGEDLAVLVEEVVIEVSPNDDWYSGVLCLDGVEVRTYPVDSVSLSPGSVRVPVDAQEEERFRVVKDGCGHVVLIEVVRVDGVGWGFGVKDGAGPCLRETQR